MKSSQLKDVATVFNGKTPSVAEQRNAGKPVLKIKNVDEFGRFKGQFESFVDESFFDKFSNKAILSGDILILNAAHNADYVGSKQYFAEDIVKGAIATGEWTVVRAKQDISSSSYLRHMLQSPEIRHNIKLIVKGIHLYPKDLEQINIPLPPLSEQKRIAAILDKADAIRRKRQQAVKLTEELLRSVFLDMFGDPVTNPKGWKEARLEDVAEIVSGVTKGRKLDGKQTIMAPYLRVANVQDGYLDLNEIKEIEVLPSDVAKYRLEVGDVLLTEGGDPDKLGRGSVWYGQVTDCIHQNHIFRVRSKTDKLMPDFLSMLIGSERGKRYFLRAAKQTTGIASINSTQLKNFPILMPTPALQQQFAQTVTNSQKLQQQLSDAANTSDSLFTSLLQRAFRGQL